MESPGDLVKSRSDSVGPGWGIRFCFFNRLPGNADAADLGATLGVAGPWHKGQFLRLAPALPVTRHALPLCAQPLHELAAFSDRAPPEAGMCST